MKKIAVLTGGGDAPGENPCIRAVVRTALANGCEAMGVYRGYAGLVEGEMRPMSDRSVGGIIQRGGTCLRVARYPEFKNLEVRKRALHNLNRNKIDALVVIGGNGSLSGAFELHRMGFPVIGVPATIDNDLPYTDIAIGVDTALNAVLWAIDRIKDTASSHRRAFLIEVMGRNSGYLALMSGIAGGVEAIVIPEVEITCQEIEQMVEDAYLRGKAHFICIVAEGAKLDIQTIAGYLEEREVGYEVRMTILGHIQRGGSPTAFDRLLATRLGSAAVKGILEGEEGRMVGLSGNEIVFTDLAKVTTSERKLDLDFYRLAQMLER